MNKRYFETSIERDEEIVKEALKPLKEVKTNWYLGWGTILSAIPAMAVLKLAGTNNPGISGGILLALGYCYGFARNAGYEYEEQLKKLGPSEFKNNKSPREKEVGLLKTALASFRDIAEVKYYTGAGIVAAAAALSPFDKSVLQFVALGLIETALILAAMGHHQEIKEFTFSDDEGGLF